MMGKNTDISWTDHTWNPWQGCKKISPGCKNCYMFSGQKRWNKDPENIHRSASSTFNLPYRLKAPCKVFVCSWSDFFLEEADEWRIDAWEIIRKTPHITYQILTKRPENIIDRLPDGWPFKNVWLGVTAENQEMADKRIPLLLNIEAKIRFVSVEPMIWQIVFDNIPSFDLDGNDEYGTVHHYDAPWNEYLDWVICGGESGTHYRDMDPAWAIDLMCQCKSTNTPFFFKQMAGINPKRMPILDCLDIKEFPE